VCIVVEDVGVFKGKLFEIICTYISIKKKVWRAFKSNNRL